MADSSEFTAKDIEQYLEQHENKVCYGFLLIEVSMTSKAY